MFFPKETPKTIYSGNKTVSPESLLKAIAHTKELLNNSYLELRDQYTEHTRTKLIEQNKDPQEIEQYISSPRFTNDASTYANNELNNKIIEYLSDKDQLGENKVEILTRCLKPLEHRKRSLIIQGIYNLTLLAEFNKVIQDTSEKEFETLLEVIIACGHLEEDIPVPEQQRQLKEAIASHQRESSSLSLQTVSIKLEEFTGIDLRNPLASLRKKLSFGKKDTERQFLGSLDEMTLDTAISVPTQCTYIALGALSFGMSGLLGAVLPLTLIGIIGKGVYSLITEDKDKEGTIHNPFPERVISQSVRSNQPQNYSAILQRQKEESEQQNTQPTSKQL
ncbi:hypothetical protein K6025_02200 [Ehrlichia sp. JZT12]